MPLTSDNLPKSTQLHRTFEGRTDWASQTELNSREAELDAMREYEAEKAERALRVRTILAYRLRYSVEFMTPEKVLCILAKPVAALNACIYVEEAFGFNTGIPEPAEFVSRTVQDMIDLVEEKLSAGQQ